MKALSIQTKYTIYADTPIQLPEDKTPSDISDISVKYGQIVITFTDGSVMEEIGETDLDFDTIDYKYPDQIRLYSKEEDESHNLLYEKEL